MSFTMVDKVVERKRKNSAFNVATGFGAAVDDEGDDVIGKSLSMTLGCRPLRQRKNQKKGRGGEEKKQRALRPGSTGERETTAVGYLLIRPLN